MPSSLRHAAAILAAAALLAAGCGESETPAKDGKAASEATSTPEKQSGPGAY